MPSREGEAAGSAADLQAGAIARLGEGAQDSREAAAAELFAAGRELAESATRSWRADAELAALLGGGNPHITVGVAVPPDAFARIRGACGSPRLAEVPQELETAEFELHLPRGVSLDILTTTNPGGAGAIARFLAKFGQGIQQVEYRTTNVDRAARILNERFGVAAVYPEARPGADGTSVNFFLVSSPAGRKVLIELYQR
ncbi:MAG TPA: hypothetical protein VEH49_04070 [Methylomirabilota bacterium]|nr:hypothetical protein [Methylomirabilota bacterium]